MQYHIIRIIMATNISPARLGLARKTLEGNAAATKYIKQFLQEHNVPDLDQMTEDHVEGKHFSNLFDNVRI